MTRPVCLLDIGFEKRSFAEKNVGLVRQGGQGSAIGCRIGQIGCIDLFFAGSDDKQAGT